MKKTTKGPTFVDIQVPESICPFCFCILDTASNTYGTTAPEPGDHTLCIRCANVLRFDENLQLVAAKWDDIPVEYRSKFAVVKMAIEECKRRWDAKPNATPWASR